MKILFPGCRVRVVNAPVWPELLGREGTILGWSAEAFNPFFVPSTWIGWPVRLDGWADCVYPPTGQQYYPPSENLEPILKPPEEQETETEEAPVEELVYIHH